MKQKTLLIQACICLAILAGVQSGVPAELSARDDKLGDFLENVAEAIRENYTLAELLDIGQETAAVMVSVPSTVNRAVLQISESSLYGLPMDEDGGELVYAVAGGRVIKSGIREGLGMYVTVEHPSSLAGGTSAGMPADTGTLNSTGTLTSTGTLKSTGTLTSTGKISTYGHLSSIRVVSGERVTKGEILGTYDKESGEDFYYALEDKSGNIS